MEDSFLYEIIKFFQYGTNLHIGVLFLGDYGNEKTLLPKQHTIHTAPVCHKFKYASRRSFEKCFKCRNMAIEKAVTQKIPFGGLCINGVYEYTRPVVINDDVACIIFIGNILDYAKGYPKILNKLNHIDDFSDTMEINFHEERCEKLSMLIETYIRMLLKEEPSKKVKINPLIENIKSYVNSNLQFDIDMEHISKLFHYNEQYLGRLFKKETGLSINEYANQQRLDHAKFLLENSDDMILDISLSAGFRNVTYFNRLFKKTYGVTPSEYKKSLPAEK